VRSRSQTKIGRGARCSRERSTEIEKEGPESLWREGNTDRGTSSKNMKKGQASKKTVRHGLGVFSDRGDKEGSALGVVVM